MKPILIHVHLYYHEMWPELERYLRSIPKSLSRRIYVTLVERNPEVEASILRFDPKATILQVENRGFDVGPFVQVLNMVNLDDYSLLIKLHSKRDMPLGSAVGSINLSGDRWRKMLLAFLRPVGFRCALRAFRQDPKLGMTGHASLIFRECLCDSVYNQSVTFLQKLGLPEKDFAYIIGTMFMCRAELMKPIQQLGFSMQDFELPDRRRTEALAYTLEALLCWIVTAQGYELRDCFTPFPKFQAKFIVTRDKVFRFLFRKKVTESGRFIVKVCGIPVIVTRKRNV